MAIEREKILDAALTLLNEVGLDHFSTRRLAERLGVQQPALYWHFKSKQEIVNGMAARLLARLRDAPLDGTDWRAWLGGMAKFYRHTLLGVRDGAEVLSNANLSRSEQFADFERGIVHLASFGFSTRDAMLGMTTVFDYALGITYEHQTDSRVAEPEGQGSAVFESLRGMRREDAAEALFDGGLELILDGLALRRVLPGATS